VVNYQNTCVRRSNVANEKGGHLTNFLFVEVFDDDGGSMAACARYIFLKPHLIDSYSASFGQLSSR